jgi:hypothetical protein
VFIDLQSQNTIPTISLRCHMLRTCNLHKTTSPIKLLQCIKHPNLHEHTVVLRPREKQMGYNKTTKTSIELTNTHITTDIVRTYLQNNLILGISQLLCDIKFLPNLPKNQQPYHLKEHLAHDPLQPCRQYGDLLA